MRLGMLRDGQVLAEDQILIAGDFFSYLRQNQNQRTTDSGAFFISTEKLPLSKYYVV